MNTTPSTTTPPSTTSAEAPSPRLPARLHAWWAASTLAAAGDSLLAFAMIWTATAHGSGAVALVSMAAVLPRIALLLVGGALGDRHGTRRVLVATTSVQLGMLAVLGSLLGPLGIPPGPGLLAAASAALATVSAIQQPAAVVHVRALILHDEQLPRVLARISGGPSAARILGVACGGAVIARSSLEMAVVIEIGILALVLAVLALQRPRPGVKGADDQAPRESILRSVADGIRSARALGIGPLLAAVALVCAAVLPAVAIAMPTAARARGWSAAEASLLESGWAAGMLAITLVISIAGTLRRHRIALVGGPAVASAALLVLAVAPSIPSAVLASIVLGAGTSAFTTHIAPTLLRRAPSGQVSRFQSLMSLVQLVPAAVMNAPVAGLAGVQGGGSAFLLAATLALAASVLGLRSRTQKSPFSPTDLDRSEEVR